jgi:O-antigen/teichoic acid export membrane protein
MDIEPQYPPSAPIDIGARALRGALVRGGLWTLARKLTVLVAVLVATPFTVRLLEPVSYGAWSLLQATVGYVVLADLGMSAASTKLAGDRCAAGDARQRWYVPPPR